jgi:hypothetical protein
MQFYYKLDEELAAVRDRIAAVSSPPVLRRQHW